jgi:phosphatase NudJ
VPREPIPTWFFALVVARKGERFLLVEERDGEWYLPAGRVEPGESFAEGAIRETLEEAGVAIALEGIFKIEHTPRRDGARFRIFFVARAVDDKPPKSVPDEESRSARWVTIEEAAALPLRSPEVLSLFHTVSRGAHVAPMKLLASERG